MASGDVIHAPARSDAPLPHAAALTSSGRISEARADGIEFAGPPFADDEMVALDDTLTSAIRATGVRFNVYVADASDPAAATDTIFPSTPEAENSVLIAVYPNQKAVEVRSGRDAAQVTDRIAQLGVTAAVGPFGQGQLIDGIISAVRVIANAIIAP
ncbi:DUF5130 family protein [Rhodococcus sp. HNM0563]|uniref:DUF5130 family protein n=1 Tax=unclassified Rhodococcus (in: high G+C Gram-positive bacteria) TaxID=192944 RepID=UPI00146E3907|nr:DUF5130 family protein [Rhodococcus sp. F64268]MCK0092378.1 DUF5130 domain-containing protein [Rhodococcus sp. F64268]NLU63124.1 DUF5130 family protein [Rhodococcus sp. HNM0563]